LTLNSGSGAISGIATATGTFTFTAQVADSGTPAQTATNSFSITVPSTVTLWPGTTVPGVVDEGPDSSVELGVKFRSDVAGNITALRFYKSAANTGTHVGNLWSSAGAKLATATFSNETASGWQQVNLAAPVAISANTVYVASYHANNGHFSEDDNYFLSKGVDNPPLHALTNGVSGGNGVYVYGASSAFPNQTWSSANYWVDIVLRNGPVPVLNSIAVTPANPIIFTGVSQQFTATGSYSDGSAQNITSQAAWVSSNTAVAAVKAGGAASAVSAGTTTITASLAGVTGSSLLTVQALPLAITSTSFPTGVVNTAYSTTLIAAGGTAPYTWSIAGGALPAGLTLNTANGVISGTPTNAGAVSFTAGVTDAGNPVQTATAALAITVASPPPSVVTLWPSTTVPAGVDGGPDSPVELGVKFRSDVPGNLAGIRFYKAAANTGTHVGNLWSSTGTLLASATFSNETASGWQQVSFGSSLGIASNTVYVASYHANNGHYSADTNYFLSKGVNSPPLHALTNGVSGGNGVYVYGTKSAFPTLTWISANYWVDLAFQPAAAPLPASMAVAPSNPTNAIGTSPQFTAQATEAGAPAQAASGARGITNAATSATPILVITNAANPFSGYYAEVLLAQGMNEFALVNIASLSSATLAPYDVVILPQAALTADQVTLLSDWVNAGGNLIAMRPDKQLTGLLGLNNTGTTLSDGCLRVDTSAGPGVGIAGETMRFYGTADLYNLASASSLAAFYSDAQTPTSFPAVTLQRVGPNGGKAAAFTYDLARSIAFTPDLDNVAIHQANEQQRFLVNMVNSMKADKKLLPR
jgi:hypothetical protein